MLAFSISLRRFSWTLGFLAGTASGAAQAAELEGFTEPLRTLQVAADETGTIDDVYVREGDRVRAGQPLVRLNSAILESLRAIAEQQMHCEGRAAAAQAELQMRQQRLEKLAELRRQGHARQEEVDRAQVELAAAAATLQAIQEDMVTRTLEHKKIETQIQRRTVRAPIDGVVATLHKDVGEFVAPNQADVITLVQIDTLLASFTLLGPQATALRVGQTLPVRFLPSGEYPGIVAFISPVNDAQSGTVLVQLRIDNAEGLLRSGQRCKIRLAE